MLGTWRPDREDDWHPDVIRLVERFAQADVPSYGGLDVAAARAVSEKVTDLQQPAPLVAEVTESTIDGPARPIRLRIYRAAPDETAPVVLYFHGGGFVLGSIAAGDEPCRVLANAARCTIVSVDYRLAPEAPFPAGLDDCVAAATWAAGNVAALGGSGPVLLFGDSAGGNLAAAVALRLRDSGRPMPAGLMLLYPTLAAPASVASASYRRFADGPLMTRRELTWFWQHYLGPLGDRRDCYAAPLLCPELTGLPPTTIVVAGLDPLHDDGVSFATRLHTAGTDVRLLEVPGAPHGLWWMDRALSQAAAVTDALVTAIRGPDLLNTSVDDRIGHS